MTFNVSRFKFGGVRHDLKLWHRCCPCVILASSSKGEHGSWFRPGAAPVFMVLQVQEVLHLDSANTGMETKGQGSAERGVKLWIFHIFPLSFLACNY